MAHILPIAGTELTLRPGPWPLPEALRADVPAVWQRLKAANPHVWDGRILGFATPVIGDDGILRADAYEDAYSVFLTWREAGFPPVGMAHMFGTAIIVSLDGALIFGVMGNETMNAGKVYPPGGSLEPRDVGADGLVDVNACIAIELLEETGLSFDDARLGPLLAVTHGPRVSISRVFHFDEPAEALLARIRANLERQEERELADVVACRTLADGERAGDLTPYAAALIGGLASGAVPLLPASLLQIAPRMH